MSEAGVNRALLYGANDVARILMGLTDAQVEIVGVVDGNYNGQDFCGVPLLKHGQLQDVVYDAILITALNNIDDAELHLYQMGILKESVWTLS